MLRDDNKVMKRQQSGAPRHEFSPLSSWHALISTGLTLKSYTLSYAFCSLAWASPLGYEHVQIMFL